MVFSSGLEIWLLPDRNGRIWQVQDRFLMPARVLGVQQDASRYHKCTEYFSTINGKVHGRSASYRGLGVSWWFNCVLPNSRGAWGATLKSTDEAERIWVETVPRKVQILPNFCPVFRPYNIRDRCPDWSWKYKCPQDLAKTKKPERVEVILGFAGYYWRFIRDYSKIVKPLNDLTAGYAPLNRKPKNGEMKGKYFNPKESFGSRWTADCDEAFDTIISKLTSAPVLGFANPTLPYTLHTDASTTCLGAALYQEQDGESKVIAFASRGLSRSESWYPAHKLEFLALKWAVTEKLSDYLYGNHFTVITDSNPLTYILSSAKLNTISYRWLSALVTFSFSLIYRSGKQNQDADGLSRRPHGELVNGMAMEWSNKLPIGVTCEVSCYGVRELAWSDGPYGSGPYSWPCPFSLWLAKDECWCREEGALNGALKGKLCLRSLPHWSTSRWHDPLSCSV